MGRGLLLIYLLLISFSSILNAEEYVYDYTPDEPIDQPKTYILRSYIEGRYGSRLQRDPFEDKTSLGELRMRNDLEHISEWGVFNMQNVFTYDPVINKHDIDIEEGEGWYDLRELNFNFKPVDYFRMQFGRQNITWGTGDLIFVNDMFPKDYISFYIGRDEEYLTSPSDVIRVSLEHKKYGADFIYAPRFDSHRYFLGRRFSYFNPVQGKLSSSIPRIFKPRTFFKDDEKYARIYATIYDIEAAFYFYTGFYKDPVGIESNYLFFPALRSMGGSLKMPFGKGNVSFEYANKKSMDDKRGIRNNIPNSSNEYLFAIDQKITEDSLIRFQALIQQTMNFNQQKNSITSPALNVDRYNKLFMTRFSHDTLDKKVNLSFIYFFSPNMRDGYIKPRIQFFVDETTMVESGLNIFYGKNKDTRFGQFQNNSNIYFALRIGL